MQKSLGTETLRLHLPAALGGTAPVAFQGAPAHGQGGEGLLQCGAGAPEDAPAAAVSNDSRGRTGEEGSAAVGTASQPPSGADQPPAKRADRIGRGKSAARSSKGASPT